MVRVDKAMERYAVTKERIVGELARMGFANMLDYMTVQSDGHPYVDMTALNRDTAAAIVEATVDEYTVPPEAGEPDDAAPRPVRKIRVKLADKRAALVDLAKLKGMMVERKELRFKRLSEMTDEELEMLLLEATGEQT
jgi:phage terminase small subunit